jgi:hypothetical protein
MSLNGEKQPLISDDYKNLNEFKILGSIKTNDFLVLKKSLLEFMEQNKIINESTLTEQIKNVTNYQKI